MTRAVSSGSRYGNRGHRVRTHGVQLPNDVGGALHAIRRHFLQALGDELCEQRRYRTAQRGDRLGRARKVAGNDLLRRAATKRCMTSQHLVRHDAKRVQIHAMIESGIRRGLLGRHVRRRAHCQPRRGERRALRGIAHGLGNAEVGHQGVSIGEQNVFRLDVAVDDAALVRVGERVGHFAQDVHRVADRQRATSRQQIAERFTVHKGHDVEQHRTGSAGIEQRQDVRVLQAGGDLDLPQKTLGAQARGELRAQHLHGDLTVMAYVFGQIHVGHTSRAYLAVEAITVAKGE